jgi:acyl-CoA reductase-like NAD-dependent aldehyde dehydrogenase
LLISVLYLLRREPLKAIIVPFPPEISQNWSSKIATDHSIKDGLMIKCYDPSTGYSLGSATPATPKEMKEIVARARTAQKSYQHSSFDLRKQVLGSLLNWVVDNQENISRMTARDSGKTLIDASFGEILTTCEKIRWTIANGESALAPEYRTPGLIMAHKIPRVEYHPVGVMGAIVSWNYPFHNVVGPVVSALMAGNAIVIKTSENVYLSS